MPVTAVDDSSATGDEDSVEDVPQQRGLMIPASMGLRFQVPADLDAFTVVASWGTYHAGQGRAARRAAVAPLPAHTRRGPARRSPSPTSPRG